MSLSSSLIRPAVEGRVDELIGRMTLEAKVGQMNQVSRLEESHQEALRRGQIGSSILASGAWVGKDTPLAASVESNNAYQRIAVQETPLGIPLLLARDVIHGHRTVFPIPLAQAAAWAPSLTEQAASIAAREAAAAGIKWVLTPMLDIARDPRWGRIAEGYGEDPYLASALAKAAVRGLQGEDMSRPDRVVACAKHYVGYGGAEGGRDYDRVDMSIRTLRDVYLPPFRAAVETGVATIMSGFHDFAGVPVAANRFLLTEVLRHEWGFGGLVVSDWNAVLELTQHGVARDAAEAAAQAVCAGVDMDMVSGGFQNHLAQLVRSGQVPLDVIDQAVRRILRVKFMAGLFEQPYVDAERARRMMLAPEHRDTARRLAQESLVLLKNDSDLLPLRSVRRLGVFGPLAQAQRELFGAWTLDGQAQDVTSIADAIREAVPASTEVSVAVASDDAISRARLAEVAVVVVGEHPGRSGEASSVTTLELPAGQRDLVQGLADMDIPIVLVVLSGRPLVLTHEVRLAQAVLLAWHPGVEGGHAIASVLLGHVTPCGKLPVTLPRRTGQVPIYYSRKNSGRPPQPDVGYSLGHVDLPETPLYPFGYGLGYTRFSYSDLQLSSASLVNQIDISAKVQNVGNLAGTEVAQLYLRDLVGSVTRPVKELKGFQRVALEPGEACRVAFTLRREELAFTGRGDQAVIEPGAYHVWIGPSSAEGLRGEFNLAA